MAAAPRLVYLTVDIDVLDLAFAPGTGTPEPGGLTTRELLWAVRRAGMGVDLCAADVVEVTRPMTRPASRRWPLSAWRSRSSRASPPGGAASPTAAGWARPTKVRAHAPAPAREGTHERNRCGDDEDLVKSADESVFLASGKKVGAGSRRRCSRRGVNVPGGDHLHDPVTGAWR